MEEEERTLPDHQRCKRTDGRQWRCSRPVMEGKKLCDLHYIQGRHRQYRKKVPESLKLQRKKIRKKVISSRANSSLGKNIEVRAKNVENFSNLVKSGKPTKRRRVIGESEALDEAVRKMKLKRGDLQLELIRMVLKREIEKRKKKERDIQESDSSDCEAELMKHLPNGLMAISFSPHIDNAGCSSSSASGSDSCFNVKIGGADPDTIALTRRQFRSKNIEPLPIGTLKVVPYKRNVENLRGGRRKRCHWCRRGGLRSLIKCSSCKEQFFCMDCINKQYSITPEEVKMACPVCHGNCSCKTCSVNQCGDAEYKDFLRDKNKAEKVLHFHYLICMLLPVLKQINKDQSIELEVEAKIKGKKTSDVQIQPAEFGGNNLYCCNCKASIVDFHRSCPKCSYNLCLSCCRDSFHGSLAGTIKSLICKCPNRRKASVSRIRLSDKKCIRTSKQNNDSTYFDSSASFLSWEAADGSLHMSCPPTEFGGCGDGLLNLRCVFRLSWTKQLEKSAEEIVSSYELPEAFDTFSYCSLCLGMEHEANVISQLQEAARREESHDNFLYYPTLKDIHGDNLDHFQKHWGKAHPVIVQNVLQDTSKLSWDPVYLFCSYLKNSIAKSKFDEDGTKATGCLDWFEVDIGIKQQLFLGSLRGQTHANMCDEKLKLKGWLSSHLFQEHFPAHYAEIIHALPVPEYMDPSSGLLNIAAKVPQEIPKPELGPCVSISYHSGEEALWPDCVTRLCYDLCDVCECPYSEGHKSLDQTSSCKVNILAYTTDAPVSMKQLNSIRKLIKKKQLQDQREAMKTTRDGKMTEKRMSKSSSHAEKMEEMKLHDAIKNEIHAHERAQKISLQAAATDHDEEDYSDPDSDSDCNSSSQALILPSAVHSSKASENQASSGKQAESSECFRDEELSRSSCGAQWDVFRRQDVPKLMEYLRKHSNEFRHTYGFQKHVVHPILDQNFFLDASHKIRLKEEYEIEPWSFEQHVGEAVIIPAGCPYQIRKVKSCVNVVLDFVSPENVNESIHLIDELRQLPENHEAKVDKLQVKKMALYSLSAAINEIRELTCADVRLRTSPNS